MTLNVPPSPCPGGSGDGAAARGSGGAGAAEGAALAPGEAVPERGGGGAGPAPGGRRGAEGGIAVRAAPRVPPAAPASSPGPGHGGGAQHPRARRAPPLRGQRELRAQPRAGPPQPGEVRPQWSVRSDGSVRGMRGGRGTGQRLRDTGILAGTRAGLSRPGPGWAPGLGRDPPDWDRDGDRDWTGIFPTGIGWDRDPPRRNRDGDRDPPHRDGDVVLDAPRRGP